AGTAHTLAHLAAPVRNLVGDGALDAFGPTVAERYGARTGPITGQVLDRCRRQGDGAAGQAQRERHRPYGGVHPRPIPAPRAHGFARTHALPTHVAIPTHVA